MKGSDVSVCNLGDNLAREGCIEWFQAELKNRRNKAQNTVNKSEQDLLNAQTAFDNSKATVKDLQDKVSNVETALDKYVDALKSAEEWLKLKALGKMEKSKNYMY